MPKSSIVPRKDGKYNSELGIVYLIAGEWYYDEKGTKPINKIFYYEST